uniref:lysozyme n=1 Tax=Timema shepardi TaxID=629360 RepID=A0A7R9AVE3_TIMSH|nr:unnamed protein product [Timema shepardi]
MSNTLCSTDGCSKLSVELNTRSALANYATEAGYCHAFLPNPSYVRMHTTVKHHVTGTVKSTVPYKDFYKPGPNYQEMELCLGCICEATTNCNLTIGCNNQGLCGPFLISQEYWIDAGTPVIRGDSPYTQGAYHRCVIEPYCAATTVRNYMRQFKQDCNQDSLFDCDDVARIHYLGGYQCGIDISHKGYYRVFKQCLNSIRQLTRI